MDNLGDPKIRAAIQNCQNKTGATAADVYILIRLPVVPATQTQFCVLGCLLTAAGVLNESNNFVPSEIMELLKNLKSKDAYMYSKISAPLTYCADKVAPGKDECESAINMMQCIDQFIKGHISSPD